MKKLLFAFLLFVSFSSFAQDANEELIYWNSGHRLTWADYKGEVNPASSAAASTATYLGIEYNFNQGKIGYKITCSFSKTKSWGKNKTDHILAHEQGHFDIAEIFARKLNMRMKQYTFNKKTYQTDLKEIYESIMKEKEKMQNDYDRETNHSIIKEKQAEWLEKIEKLLEEYKDYSDY